MSYCLEVRVLGLLTDRRLTKYSYLLVTTYPEQGGGVSLRNPVCHVLQHVESQVKG